MGLVDFGEGFLEQAGKIYLTTLDVKNMQRKNKMEEAKLMEEMKAARNKEMQDKWNTVMAYNQYLKTQPFQEEALKQTKTETRMGGLEADVLEKTGFKAGTRSQVTTISVGGQEYSLESLADAYKLVDKFSDNITGTMKQIEGSFNMDTKFTDYWGTRINDAQSIPALESIRGEFMTAAMKQAAPGTDLASFTSALTPQLSHMINQRKAVLNIENMWGISPALEMLHKSEEQRRGTRDEAKEKDLDETFEKTKVKPREVH